MLVPFLSIQKTSEASHTSHEYNSQTLPLLSLSHDIRSHGAMGGAEVQVEDGVALRASAGLSDYEFTKDEVEPVDDISVYVVREGDTLSQVAEMFSVSTNTIRWANDISGGTIVPGQILVILPVTGVRHTIEDGDTLASLAEEYDVDVRDVAEFNELNTDALLAVGEDILIPGGEFGLSEEDHVDVDHSQGVPQPSSPTIVSGSFMHPLPGSVRTQGYHGHNAVDFGAPHGTPIRAAAAGTVVLSKHGWNGGYGNYVIITHPNGTKTLYAHNSENIVSVGQSVVQGQVIGYVGVTGRTTGPHLHFETHGATNPF